MSVEKPTFENKTLMLVEGIHMDGATPLATFTGIPVNNDCPFIEIVFDPKNQVLGIISKHSKPMFQWIPRVTEDGLNVPVKNKSALASGIVHQQQRITMDTYHEYYIRSQKEVEAFLNAFAINTEFDYKKYFKKVKK